MKKITRTVLKEVVETVTVCDVCGQEGPLPIEVNWWEACSRDLCYEDGGVCHYCSVACFRAGIALGLKDLDRQPELLNQQFKIVVNGRDYEKTTELLTTFLRLFDTLGDGAP